MTVFRQMPRPFDGMAKPSLMAVAGAILLSSPVARAQTWPDPVANHVVPYQSLGITHGPVLGRIGPNAVTVWIRTAEALPFNVLVATNLHPDILSDLAAALSGSLGIGPTANLNPEKTFPSMFEPIHGSAFDIMGQGIANPIGTFWTAVMMLEHLGEHQAAARLMRAIETVTRTGTVLPRDLGGVATTEEVTDALCKAL